VVSIGLGSGFGIAALTAVLLNRRLPFPYSLYFILAVVAAAVLITLVADKVGKKRGLY